MREIRQTWRDVRRHFVYSDNNNLMNIPDDDLDYFHLSKLKQLKAIIARF